MSEKSKKIKLFRVVVFFSGSASSMRYLLERDENYGKTYVFVGAFSDSPDASGIKAIQKAGISVKINNFKEWCQKHNVGMNDVGARTGYFAEVVKLIKGWSADILMFSGFKLIVTNPLLGEYERRILNVHPADLRVIDEQGRRKYAGVGLKAVRKVMEDGNTKTYSTVHIVTRIVDEGPIVAISDPLTIWDGTTPERLQEEMKFACDGPAFQRAFERIASSDFQIPR